MSSVVLDLRRQARARAIVIDAPRELGPSARATWLARMVNEHESAGVFESLSSQLADAGFGVDDVGACRRFAREEREHGALCGAVVEILGGEARAIVPERRAVPRHERVSRLEAVLRNLLSVSCMSETVAVALIGAEWHEMPDGPLRDLLTRIWADEVGHARFGWAVVKKHVPTLPLDARERLASYLEVAFAHVEAHELAHLPLRRAHVPEGGAAYGLCSGEDARGLFYDTIEQVVVPELTQVGLPARRAWMSRSQLQVA